MSVSDSSSRSYEEQGTSAKVAKIITVLNDSLKLSPHTPSFKSKNMQDAPEDESMDEEQDPEQNCSDERSPSNEISLSET